MYYILLLLFIFGCKSPTGDDLHDQGQAIIHSLVIELQDVETRDDLILKKGQLKKLFNQFVEVLIKTKKTQVTNNEHDIQWSEQLKEELIRIYSINGAREVIESSQKDALERLHSAN